MKIAIIGGGISGLTCAYHLHSKHDITLFEKADRVGGHTATIDIDYENRHYAIDTGFIVFNDWTYPNFIELMDELGVESQETEMSFSVRCDTSGIEYGGSNLNTLFAQRSNLLSFSFHKMLRDILRFNREAVRDLENGRIDASTRLGDYLRDNHYGEAFCFQYLVPMGCAIWSASTKDMLAFPLLFFVRFFRNHGLLNVNHRPQWRVIQGGSRQYLEPLCRGFRDSIRLNSRIARISRQDGSVSIVMRDGRTETYDQVVFACHSDQVLELLADPDKDERAALAAIPYQSNEVVLHHDDSILPRRKRAWSSWNYWLREPRQNSTVLTYNMNILQSIEAPVTFCVTLNATGAIDPAKIIRRFNYSHPMYSLDSIAASRYIDTINGMNRTWFAGAYLGNGFHEDGVVSGRKVAQAINGLPAGRAANSILRRAGNA